MTKEREIHPEAARAEALKWLEISLEDEDGLEEFWTEQEAIFEEPPALDSILALAPQILTALKSGQPLPAMSREQQEIFKDYLEGFENTIATSTLANTTDEEIRDNWTGAVIEAWVALQQPLCVGWTEQEMTTLAEITPEDLAAASTLWQENAPTELKGLLD